MSTGRQAAHELSLDEQDRKIRACAEPKDGDIVEMFIEQGASGRTDKRPVFQQKIAFALDRGNAVDVVIVHNFSRYLRNVASYLQYRTPLKNAGVRLISATQDVPEGAIGKLIETIFAAFDGHASDMNAATVRDMMIANAEAGYWNGARQPFGYETRTVVVLRKEEKKSFLSSRTRPQWFVSSTSFVLKATRRRVRWGSRRSAPSSTRVGIPCAASRSTRCDQEHPQARNLCRNGLLQLPR